MVTMWIRYVASNTVCLSCVTSIKSIFSKSCFLANNGTFSLYVRGEGIPVKREGTEWEREATLAQKRQRMPIQKAGVKVKSASMPATAYITQLALTWQITHSGTDLGSITGITSMWGRTVLQQSLQNVWHQSTFLRKQAFLPLSISVENQHFLLAAKETSCPWLLVYSSYGVPDYLILRTNAIAQPSHFVDVPMLESNGCIQRLAQLKWSPC